MVIQKIFFINLKIREQKIILQEDLVKILIGGDKMTRKYLIQEDKTS